MGQYVTRGGKQYYKADDGKLYTSFQGANQARIGSTVEGKIAGGVADFLNTVAAVPGAMASAFYDPTKRFGRPAAAEPTPRTQLVKSGDAQLGDDPGSQFPAGRRKPDTTDTSKINLGLTPVPPGRGPTPIIQAADDEYNRLKSQYGGPAGVEQLAMQTSLPVGFTPAGAKGPASLKDFYSAERQVGGRDIESIIPSLTQGLDPTKAQKIKEWATANPMLAQREYAKKMGADQAAAGYGGTGPSDEAIRAAISGGKFFPSAGSPSPIANPPEFGTPANAVPAPPMDQGKAVSAPYAEAQRQAAEKTAGATGMPKLETTPEATPGKQFLGRALSSPWGQALTNTLGSMGIDYIQGIR